MCEEAEAGCVKAAFENLKIIRQNYIPPEYIRDRLQPLHSLCTRTLLERLRRDTIEKEGLLPHQWTCMGEELLALDRCMHVPRDSHKMQEIFIAIKSVPEYFLALMRNAYLDVEFELYPMGSFTTDAKVFDVNEFDFMIIIDEDPPDKIPLPIGLVGNIVSHFKSITEKKQPPIDSVLLRTQNAFQLPEPIMIIREEYLHSPSRFIQVVWTCHNRHVHKIDINITIGFRRTDFLKEKVVYLKDIPVFNQVYEQISPNERAVHTKYEFTKCTLDKRMWSVLAKQLPNTLVLYRLLKVLVKFIIPTSCSVGVNSTKSTVSSHELKQILCSHISKNPHRELWQTEFLHERLSDILLVIVGKLQNIITYKLSDIKSDEVFGCEIKSKAFEAEIPLDLIQMSVNNFVRILKTSYSVESICHHNLNHTKCKDIDHIPLPPHWEQLIYHKGKLYPCRSILQLLTPEYMYEMKMIQSLSHKHPLLLHCENQIRKFLTKREGDDLSVLVSPSVLTYTWQHIKMGRLHSPTFIYYDPDMGPPFSKPEFCEYIKFGMAFLPRVTSYRVYCNYSGEYLEVLLGECKQLIPGERAFLHIWCVENRYHERVDKIDRAKLSLLSKSLRTVVTHELFTATVNFDKQREQIKTGDSYIDAQAKKAFTEENCTSTQYMYENIVLSNISDFIDDVRVRDWRNAIKLYNEVLKVEYQGTQKFHQRIKGIFPPSFF